MPLKIYGAPRSRAIRPLWMAHELGITYELIEIAAGAKGSRTAPYLAINPNGRVPFIDDDGLVLWESFAITLHLARTRGGPMAPAGEAELSLATMWSLWAATELEPLTQQALMHSAMLPEPDRIPALRDAALERMNGPLGVLESELARLGGHLVGGRFMVADLNVACIIFMLRGTPQALDAYPGIRKWYADCRARPAAQAAFALRGE